MNPTIPDSLSGDAARVSMAEALGRRGMSDLYSGTIVVVPSLTFPEVELRKIVGIEHYEERMLCMLLLLQRRGIEIVFVTSAPVSGSILDYYASFIPEDLDIHERLQLISADDPAPRALSQKILERPDLVAALRKAVSGADDAYLFPFNVTPAEQAIADELGVPLYGPPAELAELGSKSGARHVARVAGVPVVPGSEDLGSVGEVEEAIHELVRTRPDCKAVVVKLNNGFSGQGNAIIEVADVTTPLERSRTTFCASEETWPSFAEKIAGEGAVVEELVRAKGLNSPSVQMRIFPDGEYEIVSTHDQILGGPDDQVYLGCRFPARDEYRTAIQAYGLGIARELASHGVIGSFGIDFIAAPDGTIFMSEINLRLGGTTHPFLMARFASGGVYDPGIGELVVGDGTRVYVATDNIKSDRLKGKSPAEVIAMLRDAGLAYDPDTATGVTLHLLGAVPRYGKLGAVCIAATMPEADDLYGRLRALFEVSLA